MYYFILTKNKDDWDFIRTANSFHKLLGAKYSHAFLVEFYEETKKHNYIFAMIHYAYLECEYDSAILYYNKYLKNLDELEKPKVSSEYLLTAVRLLLLKGLHLNAIDLYKNWKFILFQRENLWAARAIFRDFSKRLKNKALVVDILNEYILVTNDDDKDFSLFLSFFLELHSNDTYHFSQMSAVELEFHDFVKKNISYQSALDVACKLEENDNAIDHYTLERMAIDHLQNKQGFSFVRMGDGEGRFVGNYKHNYNSLYLEAVEIASRIWFWNSSEFPKDGFWQRLEKSFVNANVVGFNPVARVAFESGNVRHGYIGVVNGNEFVSQNLRPSQALLPNGVVRQIDYGEILKVSKKTIVIGPHDSQKEVIERIFNISDVEGWIIPAENHPNLLNINENPHFPCIFERTINEISELDRSGTVFLVAAGVYGKIYCDVIRESNGCALDIGSLLDQWMGIKTR